MTRQSFTAENPLPDAGANRIALSDKSLVKRFVDFYSLMDMYADGEYEDPDDVLSYLRETRDPVDSFGSFGEDMLEFIFKEKKESSK